MPILFYSTAKRAIAPIVKPLGFRSQGRFYYRIIDNVVQQFCLLWRNHDFTVRFHISSVYAENDRYMEGNEVAKLIDGTNTWLGQRLVPEGQPQRFSLQGPASGLFPDSSGYANTCVDVLTEYLLPWFNAASDSASAYRMAKEAKLFLTPHQEPDSHRSLGFLLDQKQWEQSAILIKYYLDHGHLYNQKWWTQREREYQPLYQALIHVDTAYLDQYMSAKKAETYRLFHDRQ